MVAVKVFVEGGGATRAQQAPLRSGFRTLFAQVLGDGPKPQVVASGGREKALDDFAAALKSGDSAHCLLLVDSEGPVRQGASPWEHVSGGKKPAGAEDEQLHLMVQVMKAWFLANPDALVAYYGKGFRKEALPSKKNVEQIPKADVFAALDRATRDAGGKGRYDKAHGFDLIGRIDPAKVRKASPHAQRFFDALTKAVRGE